MSLISDLPRADASEAEASERHWRGMPEFVVHDLGPRRTIEVQFRKAEDAAAFARLIGQNITPRTRSVWYPPAEIGRLSNKYYVSVSESSSEHRTGEEGGRQVSPAKAESLPRYPVYVPSKGRWESRFTVRALDRLGVPHYVVVEPQEADEYAKVLPSTSQLLVLPHRDKGLVVTRNWIWDHARDAGAARFWTIDDNVKGFYRFNRNLKVRVRTGAIFRAMEDFVERYENVPIAGMHYFMFVSRKERLPPFYRNTRVYSNMLIQTDVRDKAGRPFRNEGFYNDDTDLCLRVLKAGWCTILFNAFLIEKAVTMTVSGGMTPHYLGDGRWKMARELQRRHPDVTTITRKWGRWQHHVDYRPFEKNELRLKPGVEIPEGVNEYGMRLEVDGQIVDNPADYLPGGGR